MRDRKNNSDPAFSFGFAIQESATNFSKVCQTTGDNPLCHNDISIDIKTGIMRMNESARLPSF
jgi:hypothetical protein